MEILQKFALKNRFLCKIAWKIEIFWPGSTIPSRFQTRLMPL